VFCIVFRKVFCVLKNESFVKCFEKSVFLFLKTEKRF